MFPYELNEVLDCWSKFFRKKLRVPPLVEIGRYFVDITISKEAKTKY
jgi:hypothetical protein